MLASNASRSSEPGPSAVATFVWRAAASARSYAPWRSVRDSLSLLEHLLGAMRKIANLHARVTWITSGYGWAGLVFPIIVASPGYFFGTMTLGSLFSGGLLAASGWTTVLATSFVPLGAAVVAFMQ